ncbi:Hypothetical predicted protein [Cloeon dipterum]|uniref:Glycylpeptide N-tetradecanoyltransferase n=1 Tax=Cloeon dipterum TaxID=197152 RepID=A0A8S1DF01_9INSE|nr:Hypothetical predicted protein [Cloeon dipterum]
MADNEDDTVTGDPQNYDLNQKADGPAKAPLSKSAKKRRRKNEAAQAIEEAKQEEGRGSISIEGIKAAMEMLTMQHKPAKTQEEALQKQYQFWNTQPVPKMDEKITSNEPIEDDKSLKEIRQESYSLPDGFQWDTLDLNDPLVLTELYTLLNENYVEDDDSLFRFDYPQDFLKWALQPPGWLPQWHCGVRVTKNNRLVGFISAVPASIRIYEKVQRMVEINFLCVHKKLRSKRVAPVLIREITRRVNQQGIFQAVYTAGVVLPKPVGACRYYHRSLNPKKLIEVKFSHLARNMTLQRTLKLNKLPDMPKTEGFRILTLQDLDKTHAILDKYLESFDLAPVFSKEDFKHWFLPRAGIVDAYVVEKNGKITDFVSYYTLPSTVMNHPIHKSLKAAYSFYNVSTTTPLIDLMNDALVSAKNVRFLLMEVQFSFY